MKKMIPVIALVLVVAALLGVYFLTRPETQKGEKTITVTVVHKDGTEKVFSCKTTEETLGAVLLAEKIVEGEVGQFGLYIQYADGELADYSVDQGFWAIYDGEESATVGADSLPVVDGGSYKLVYTIG